LNAAELIRRSGGIAAICLVAGCATVRPTAVPVAEVVEGSKRDRTIAGEVPPIQGVLTIDEAIARALRFNLDQRVSRAEHALATRQFDMTKPEMLPNVMASAGYTTRDEDLTRRSVDSVTGGPSNANPFISQERTHLVTKLGVTWNLLDFGTGYYNAKQQANRILIAQERRRKAVHLLIQDVQTAFWRAYSAQILRSQILETIKLGESALEDARTAEEERLRSPLDSLRFQRQILENLRTLESLDQELSTAKLELARLINMGPEVQFELAEPSTKFTDELFETPSAVLEETAIRQNADLREQYYNVSNARLEGRKALVRLFPRLSFDYGFNYDDDRFLINNTWNEAGVQLAYGLLNIWTIPLQRKLSQAGLTLAEQRRMSTLMSIISQVHVSRLQYTNARRLFDRADALTQVEERIVVQMANREQVAVQGKLETVSSKTSLIISLLRRYQALAAVYAAESRLQATLGLDPGLENADNLPLEDLSSTVRSYFANWRQSLPKRSGASSEGAPSADVTSAVPKPAADSSAPTPIMPILTAASISTALPAVHPPAATPKPGDPVQVASRTTAPSALSTPMAEIGVIRGMVVNLGVYSSLANASRAKTELMPRLPQELRASSKVVQARVNGRELYRVVIDGLPNKYRANLLCGRLKAEGVDCYAPL
jgi:outer membrane protein TolC